MELQCAGTVGGVPREAYTFNYELRAVTPERIVLTGGRYITGDGWVSPGCPGCDRLFFRADGESGEVQN